MRACRTRRPRRTRAGAWCPRRPRPSAGAAPSPRSPRRSPRARAVRPPPSSPSRAPSSPAAAAASRRRSRSGSPARSAASVPQWTKRRTPARAHAASAFSVPVTLPRTKSSRVAPLAEVRGQVVGDIAAGGALGHRCRVVEVAADRLGAELRDSRRRAVGARQGAHGGPGATRRRIRTPPMKPEPPVTNAALTVAAPTSAARRGPRSRPGSRRRRRAWSPAASRCADRARARPRATGA